MHIWAWVFLAIDLYSFCLAVELSQFVTSTEDSATSAIEGFGTDLQCIVNACKTTQQKVKWYKDGKVITTDRLSYKDRFVIKHHVAYDTSKDCSGPCAVDGWCRDSERCLGNSCCACANEEYSLAISNLSVFDTGVYKCALEPGSNSVEINLTVLEGGTFPTFGEKLSFDYTQCCEARKMSPDCLPLCKPGSLETHKFDPVPCQKQFDKLLHCATEGGNVSHVHCCRLNFVPPFCWQYCSGAPNDNYRTNRLCVYWMPEILSCYDRGYAPFPGPPEQVAVTNISAQALQVCWQKPQVRGDTVDYYTVRYQEVPRFPFLVGSIPFLIADADGPQDDEVAERPVDELLGFSLRKKRQASLIISTHNSATNETEFREFKYTELNTTETCLIVDQLKPSTQYSLYVVATNYYGSSLASLRQNVATAAAPLPNVTLPNVKECCARNGVDASCMAKLCDVQNPPNPSGAFNLAFACRREFNRVAPCLTDGRDHTLCCREKGVGGECLKLCGGAPSGLGMASVLCLSLDIQSIYLCYREGYALLPSPPVNVTAGQLSASGAVVSWSEPLTNVRKATGYSLYYKQNDVRNYVEIKNATSPYTLFNLSPDTTYDAYVTATAERGSSLKSATIMFTTAEPVYDNVCRFGKILRDSYDEPFACGLDRLCPPLFRCVDGSTDDPSRMFCCPTESLVESTLSPSIPPNVTRCCESKGVKGDCLTLCNYNVSAGDLGSFGSVCLPDLAAFVECGGAGRNNSACCRMASPPITDHCLDLCQPPLKRPELDYASCAPQATRIIKCSLEGVLNSPAPPQNVRLEDSGYNWATVGWDRPPPPSAPAKTFQFVLRDQSDGAVLIYNTSGLSITIEDLQTDVQYAAHVISTNSRGSSLPSQTITFALTQTEPIGLDDYKPRPPSNVEKVWYKRGKANITWSWQNRSVTNKLIEKIKFKVAYKRHIADKPMGAFWQTANTTDSYAIIGNLTPAATYDIKVTAVNFYKAVESIPSETLNILTQDVRQSPRVEIKTQPDSAVVEGDSIVVTCRAYGDPTPLVTLRRSNEILVKDVGVVSYVFKHAAVEDSTESIFCLADNGGQVISQRFNLIVKYKPLVSAGVDRLTATQDASAKLYCRVQGYPKPKLSWLFQPAHPVGTEPKQTPIKVKDDAFYAAAFEITDKKNVYNASLQIIRPKLEDSGFYYCKACASDVGCSNSSVRLTVEPFPAPKGPDHMLTCCKEQRVSSECISACTSELNIQLYDQRCVNDIVKLLRCAKDGMDNRRCCSQSGVPTGCLDYCSGSLLLDDSELVTKCVRYRSEIVTCVQDSHKFVAGPPSNLRVSMTGAKELNASWEPPSVNAASVQMYVLYYKKDSDVNYTQIRTDRMYVGLDNLEPNRNYNFTVIAVNAFGFSAFSKLVSGRVGLAGGLSDDFSYSTGAAGTALSVLLCLVIAGLIVATVVYLSRNPRRLPSLLLKIRGAGWGVNRGGSRPAAAAVAFENPGFDTDGRLRGLPGQELESSDELTWTGNRGGQSAPETPGSSPASEQRGMRYTQLA